MAPIKWPPYLRYFRENNEIRKSVASAIPEHQSNIKFMSIVVILYIWWRSYGVIVHFFGTGGFFMIYDVLFMMYDVWAALCVGCFASLASTWRATSLHIG